VKKKQFTYLLLACVVLLWGLILFKVYAAVSDEEIAIEPIKTQKSNYFNLVNHENDSIVMELNYRDPFMESNNEPVVDVQTTIVIPQPATTIKKKVINWAEITYKGYITNPASKKKIAIVFINGKETMLTEGQTVNGLKLLRYLGDSIKVNYQNETKFINLR
jgi:hypothetical protein